LQVALSNENQAGNLARPTKTRTYYGQVFQRARRSPNAIFGMTVLLIMILLALLAQQLAPFDPLEMRVGGPFEPPSAEHWMGTDNFGRDILSRVLFGTRISLVVGFVAVLISVVLGTLAGVLAGYYGGWWDRIIMRVIDAMLAFPGILLALAIVATLGSSLINVMIAVGISAIPTYTRVVRGVVLTSKAELYVLAARSTGVPTFTLIRRHLLPNILAPLIVLSTVSIGVAIISAASLGYLGMGAQPPTPEWGLLLNQGRSYMRQAWWITTFPGLFIMLTVFAINTLGDGLRDALDPRMGE
jgi:peptide/nickel transport system permease protein